MSCLEVGTAFTFLLLTDLELLAGGLVSAVGLSNDCSADGISAGLVAGREDSGAEDGTKEIDVCSPVILKEVAGGAGSEGSLPVPEETG